MPWPGFHNHSFATQAVSYYVYGGDELEVAVNTQHADDVVYTLAVIRRYIEAAPYAYLRIGIMKLE